MIDQKQPVMEVGPHPLPASLIHDLRASLNLIIGYSELMTEQVREGAGSTIVPELEKVHTAGLQMLGTIELNLIASGSTAQSIQYELAGNFDLLPDDAQGTAKGLLLVVDDEKGNREILSRRLEKLGYTVANASDWRPNPLTWCC
jgi:sigma-B regulation protein RsbU (phosphoserine phosphatase)